MPYFLLYLLKPTQLKMNKQSQSISKKGVIKFYNEAKGFGFIVDEESGNDIFFHRSRFNGEVSRKDQDKSVTYTEFEGKKGVEAQNVSVI